MDSVEERSFGTKRALQKFMLINMALVEFPSS